MNTKRLWVEHRWLISLVAFAVLLLVVMLVPFKLGGDSAKTPPQRELPAPLKQSEKSPPSTLEPGVGQQTKAPPTDFDYLYAKAAELEFDISHILKFVREKIARQNYSGSLRGPLGTFWSSAGNDIDRFDLLAQLLKRSGERVRFARENEVFWVQIHHDGKWTNVTLDQDQQLQPPTWTGDEIPAELRCRLRIEVEVRAGEKHDLRAIELDTANLAGNPLALTFTENEYRLQQLCPTKHTLLGRCTRADEETLTLIFTFRQPGGAEETTYRREIHNGRFSDLQKIADFRNKHIITALPGLLPQWAFKKEARLARKIEAPKEIAQGYLLTLSHLAASDDARKTLEKHFQTSSYCTEPRVIIASAYHLMGQDGPAAWALDLRRNVVHVEGDEKARARFAVSRSILEGGLEAQTLRRATGAPVIASLEVFRQHMAPFQWSTPDRVALYENALRRFAQETLPGAALTVSTGKKHKVEFLHSQGETIEPNSISEPLLAVMENSKLPWQALRGNSLKDDLFHAAAVELEALFGPLAKGKVDYQPVIEIRDSLSELVRPGVRVFNRSFGATIANPFTRFDYQIVKMSDSGDLVYDSVLAPWAASGHEWDDRNNQQARQTHRLRISPEALESSTLISHWTNQRRIDRGALSIGFSRKMHHELKSQGYTLARFLKHDNSVSKPIKLYLWQEADVLHRVNGQKRKLRLLWAVGDYQDLNKPKQSWYWIRNLKDTTGPRAVMMNRWIILDNPRLPLFFSPGTQLQTAIPGRVVSSTTGRGVGDVEITIVGAESKGTSWMDGQFRLPAINRPLGKFVVQAQRRGYKPAKLEIDLSDPKVLPLKLKLEPLPAAESMLWIGAKNAPDQIAQIPDPHIRELVRQALDDNPHLSALVPKSRVNFGVDSAHAWLLFDNKTFDITPVTEDGLHGVAGRFALQAALNRADVRGLGVNAYSGAVASWYSYSAGRLDALAKMMAGEHFDDLGHDHAIQFALDFLKSIKPEGLMAGAAFAAGVNIDAFEAGFLAGLLFFENNPQFSGR